MKCINNPALLASQHPISVNFIMACSTGRRKKLVTAKPLSDSSSLMMDILAFGFLAPLTNRMEGQVSLLNLCILFVFTLALGGCIPQPSAALETLRSFQWSF